MCRLQHQEEVDKRSGKPEENARDRNDLDDRQGGKGHEQECRAAQDEAVGFGVKNEFPEASPVPDAGGSGQHQGQTVQQFMDDHQQGKGKEQGKEGYGQGPGIPFPGQDDCPCQKEEATENHQRLVYHVGGDQLFILHDLVDYEISDLVVVYPGDQFILAVLVQNVG